MLQKLKLALLSFSALFMFAMPLAIAGSASALTQDEINNNLCSGSNGDLSGTTTGNCEPSASASTANSLVRTVVNILPVVVGIVAVIMIIVGGFRYITSGGKQESVTGAKNTILYAVIGLVVVALAQLIVHFVLGKTNTAASGT